MAVWPLQQAGQELSTLVERAIDDGPQLITRDGAEVAVLVAADTWRDLTASRRATLKDILLASQGTAAEVEALEAVGRMRGQWLRRRPTAVES